MYFFLEFLPFTKTTIGAILKNASSPFEFNSDSAAQGPSNPGRYNAMSSSAGRNPRRHSGKRSVVAGMTSVSLALAGLTVPSVSGGVGSGASLASAQETDTTTIAARFSESGLTDNKWAATLTLDFGQAAQTFNSVRIEVPAEIESTDTFPDKANYSVRLLKGRDLVEDLGVIEGVGGGSPKELRTLAFTLPKSVTLPDENLALQFRYEDGTYSDFPTDAGASAAKLRAVINEVDMTGSVSDVVVDQYEKPVEGTKVELIDG
ncbi:hypothetical protein, partial [Corynebacterium sp. MSK008]|uniref:hypothetical protein n=1 Tax=Corynebacterium sp. MSK008 TaxID=3050188 RepID=UPI00254C7579